MSVCRASKSIEFDAGHRVPYHASKCRNPHGHRYRVTAVVEGPIRDASGGAAAGMVVDFGCIKDILTDHVHDVFDHGFLVWESDRLLQALLAAGSRADEDNVGVGWNVIVLPCIPTAEELARWIWNDTVDYFCAEGVRLVEIEVRETPTSIATYHG